MHDGHDGGGSHYGAGGAVLSRYKFDKCEAAVREARGDSWCTELPPPRPAIPPGPSTEPGPPPSHVESDDALAQMWPGFSDAVHARLERGARDYGDRSFHRSPLELLDEQIEEALDIAGWGFVLYVRLTRLRDKLEAAERKAAE